MELIDQSVCCPCFLFVLSTPRFFSEMCRQRPGQTADLRPAVGPPVLPELQLQVSGSCRRVWRTEEGKRARSSTGESSETGTRICTQPYIHEPEGKWGSFFCWSADKLHVHPKLWSWIFMYQLCSKSTLPLAGLHHMQQC